LPVLPAPGPRVVGAGVGAEVGVGATDEGLVSRGTEPRPCDADRVSDPEQAHRTTLATNNVNAPRNAGRDIEPAAPPLPPLQSIVRTHLTGDRGYPDQLRVTGVVAVLGTQ